MAGQPSRFETRCTGSGQRLGTAYTVRTDSGCYYQWWLNSKDKIL